MCFKHLNYREPFRCACSWLQVWPLPQTPRDRHLLWALPHSQATASFGPTICPLIIQHIFWRFLWEAAPLHQGLKEKRFLLVSLLLLALPILRTNLSLIKHTSKLCGANNTFHLKYCSVIMKVNYDLFCAPTCVARNRWLNRGMWLGTGRNEHCHLEKSRWSWRVSVLGI